MAREQVDARHRTRRDDGLLRNVQALRAVAVVGVVLFHLWPARLPGGFAGVDVFFVISGFLITAHLLRELDVTGRLRFGRFYARRARRLLPSALLVLVATLAAVWVVGSEASRLDAARDIGAAALYAANWVFAASAVDYFAEDDAASPVLHYWSLGVEEQFYLVWPIALLLIALAARRSGSPRTATLAILGVVTVLGFAVGVAWTGVAPEAAYLVTPTHIWEFAVGAVIAASGPRLLERFAARPAVAAATSWTGLIAIAASFAVLSGDTPFPGWAALLPVVGAAAVVVAGMPSTAWGPSRLMALRPVQFVGRVSYALYLWHWPPIVLLPIALGRELGAIDKVMILLGCLGLAWATTALVEDPIRRRRAVARTAPSILAAVAASALVATAAFVPAGVVADASAQRAQSLDQIVDAAIDDRGSCVGALAAADAERCDDQHVADPRYGPAEAAADTQAGFIEQRSAVDPFYHQTCTTVPGTSIERCDLGAEEPTARIVLVGDSHVNHLLRPFATLAQRHDWHVTLIYRTSCRAVIQDFVSPIEGENEPGCQNWKQQVIPYVAGLEADLIVTSAATQAYVPHLDEAELATVARAFDRTWRTWLDGGKRVLAVSDVPRSPARSVPECVASAGPAADPCSLPRDEAVGEDALLAAARWIDDPRVGAVDLVPAFCDADVCHSIVGGIITHRDTNHMTPMFAATFMRQLDAAVAELLR